MSLPADIIKFQLAQYMSLSDLYDDDFLNNPAMVNIMLSRPFDQVLDLIIMTQDPNLVKWTLARDSKLKNKIVNHLILSKQGSLLEKLIEQNILRLEEVYLFPSYYLWSADLSDANLENVGEYILQLLDTMRDIGMLNPGTIYSLMEGLAEEYQDTTPMINGVQYDFASHSELKDPWYIAETLFFPNNVRRLDEIQEWLDEEIKRMLT